MDCSPTVYEQGGEAEQNPTQWTHIVREGKKQQQQEQKTLVIVRTKDEDGNRQEDDIKAADKKVWLYIGKLKPSTTVGNVKKYLSKNGIQGQVECEELTMLGGNKAFKVGISFHYLNITSKANFWSRGSDPTSPLLFNIATADITNILQNMTDTKLILYVNDMVLGSPNREELQATLMKPEKWVKENHPTINFEKTVQMTFRKGGKHSEKIQRLDKKLWQHCYHMMMADSRAASCVDMNKNCYMN
ncbi:hypothetical protein ANN_26164 [Periplaneta americana]|uniref:Reverse transcriptase domain-containing protein n=1 Tax=Periplaneta americana TaxID=6978 RepID=A0ABQ8S570_PERAM|nr:hypothetical protein ANN_26164 [Periplaneta americana]